MQRVDKGGVPPVDGALGASELAEVVRDVLEQHPDHEHAKEGRQNDVHPHQLAQKAAEQFDTESAWSADWSQMEPSVFNLLTYSISKINPPFIVNICLEMIMKTISDTRGRNVELFG